MKYLNDYFIFKQDKKISKINEADEDPPLGKNKLNSEEILGKKSSESKPSQTGSGSGSGSSAGSGSKSGTDSNNNKSGEQSSNTGDYDQQVEDKLKIIRDNLENAFNEDHSDYFFRIHSSWMGDDENDAWRRFLGEEASCKKIGGTGYSWWCRNVITPLSNIDATKIKNSDLKNDLEKFKGNEFWSKIKTAIKDHKTVLLLLDKLDSITIGGDFGTGEKPESKALVLWRQLGKKNICGSAPVDFQNLGKGINELKNITRGFGANCPEDNFYYIMQDIVVLFDKLFKNENAWKNYSHWYGDKDNQAADAIADMGDKILTLLNELKIKIDGSGLDTNAKTHLKKQADRIYMKDAKTGLIGSIISRMRGYWDERDVVEFEISSFSTNKKILVEIDTDF